jgi:hypothetical protein
MHIDPLHAPFSTAQTSSLLSSVLNINHVATLALGLRPKQGLAKVRTKREARESHLMLMGV